MVKINNMLKSTVADRGGMDVVKDTGGVGPSSATYPQYNLGPVFNASGLVFSCVEGTPLPIPLPPQICLKQSVVGIALLIRRQPDTS